jgi:hypothetical protein
MGCSILSFGVAPNKQTLCLHPIFQISSRELWNPIQPSILRFFNSCANTTWFVLGCWICGQFYDKLTSFKIPFSASLFHRKWHKKLNLTSIMVPDVVDSKSKPLMCCRCRAFTSLSRCTSKRACVCQHSKSKKFDDPIEVWSSLG